MIRRKSHDFRRCIEVIEKWDSHRLLTYRHCAC